MEGKSGWEAWFHRWLQGQELWLLVGPRHCQLDLPRAILWMWGCLISLEGALDSQTGMSLRKAEVLAARAHRALHRSGARRGIQGKVQETVVPSQDQCLIAGPRVVSCSPPRTQRKLALVARRVQDSDSGSSDSLNSQGLMGIMAVHKVGILVPGLSTQAQDSFLFFTSLAHLPSKEGLSILQRQVSIIESLSSSPRESQAYLPYSPPGLHL